MAQLSIVQPGQTRTRKKRNPHFNIAGTMKPYGIYPMWATPVLPGETLTKMEMRYRLLSLPVKHPFVGANFETFLFYVSLTDLDAKFAEMFIADGVATTGFTASADAARYFVKQGQIDYLNLAVRRIVAAYFRDEDEASPFAADKMIDGVPMARRDHWDWAQNLMFTPDNLDPTLLPSAMPEDGTLTPLEIMRLAGMSEITYEKYLQQYGVSQKEAVKEARLPEVLRYTREWTTPTNTVDAASGRPSSAFAWGGNIGADKAKRFDEPGFLVMIGCVRPKLYEKWPASMIGELWGFADWFPVYNLDDPAAGLKTLDLTSKVIPQGANTNTLMYDHRDLLSRGETFVNDWSTQPYSLPEITARSVVEATADPWDVRNLYPKTTDLDALFVENDAESPSDARRRLFYEGVANVEITGHVVDTTR